MDDFAESAAPATEPASPTRSGYRWLLGAIGFYLAGLLVYSQTRAYTGDEGFHFLTDQLIRGGMRPYLDFCYPQASLNNYWNAMWMGVFGESWRAIHVITALLATAAILLMADYVFHRFPISGWRLGAALAVVAAAGLNQVVVEYGTLGQAYGMCLFATAVAFRCAIVAVDRRRPWMAMAAGFFAGVAAASSLLSLAAAPVLLLWMFFRNREGNRWWRSMAAACATIVPFAPMIWLFTLGPEQVWFNLVQYHVFFRKLYWSETTEHDLEVMTSWIDCGQALLLGLLAVGGILFLAKRSQWPRTLRSEFYLCGWLSLCLIAELGFAHPTFARYFVLAVPFLGALAAVGTYALADRLLDSKRPLWPVLLLAFLSASGLARSLWDRHDMRTWGEYEVMARKVMQVTPKNGSIWADEQMYFLTHKRPSPGFEFGYSHKVNLPPAKMKLLHIVSEEEVSRRVKSRIFNTVFTCDDDEIESLGLNKLYSWKAPLDDCTVFWGAPPPEGGHRAQERSRQFGEKRHHEKIVLGPYLAPLFCYNIITFWLHFNVR
jgi:hypothetical protein